MDNSNILYERSDFANLLRLAINRNDPYYIAMIMMDSSSAILIDIREPGRPIDDLNGHTNCVNSLA